MLTKIKIILGDSKHEEKGKSAPPPGLDSFIHDVQNIANKTTPKPEDHALIAKIVRMMRKDDSNPNIGPSVSDHGSLCDCPACKKPSGIHETVKEMLYGKAKPK